MTMDVSLITPPAPSSFLMMSSFRSRPYTSPQNGKTERMIHTTNDVVRSLLFQTSLPTRYWAESLHAATYILNLLPTKAISAPSPHFALFGTTPSYAHLRVFRCACYPNTSATAPHKLAPHFYRCVFLRYSYEHKGYRCLYLTTNHMVVSRHAVFGESFFPFAFSDTPLDDLDSLFSSSPAVQPIAPPYPSSIAGTSKIVATPRMAPAPQPTPHAASTPQPVPPAAPASPFTPSSMPRAASTSCFTQSSGSHTRALSRRVVSLPPRRHGS
jgi:hypothetical protein